MSHLRDLWILGVAEPFWKNAIFKVMDGLDYASHRDHIRIVSFTNGSVFGDKTRERYMREVSQSNLHFSIDAASPETYCKIRRLDFYKTVKKNVIKYSEERPPNHMIGICHNINRLNFHEIPQMVTEADEMGADWLDFNFTHNAGGHIDLSGLGLREEDREEFEKYAAEAKAMTDMNVKVNILRTFDQAVEQA